MSSRAIALTAAPIEAFNRDLKKLVNSLVEHFPGDAKVFRAKQRIMVGLDQFPTAAIENNVGPVLYQYREQICSGNDAFFLATRYEVGQAGDADAELGAYIVPKIKEAWAASGAEVRQAYVDLVQGLLESYLDFLDARLAQQA